MAKITNLVALAVCVVLGASHPIDKLPVLRRLTLLNEVLFQDNKEFVLECITEGKVDGVKYNWLKDGKPFTPSSEVVQRDDEGTLVFKNPTKNDEGVYQCLGESHIGVASAMTKVRRVYSDDPTVIIQKHKPEEGKTYKLECKIPKSYPKPTITWYAQSGSEKKRVQGQRFTVSDKGDLYFSNVTKEDTGNTKYVCVGELHVVNKEVVLAEHVLEDVVPQKDGDHEVVKQYVTEDITLNAGDSFVYLYCIYGGNPLAHPDWFKDGKDINNSANDRVTRYNKSVGKRLLIREVLPEDEGTYSCTVDNEVGRPQKHTFNVKVVGAPKFETTPEQKLIVKPGDDVKITCEVFGISKPNLSWSYNTKGLPKNENIREVASENGNVASSVLIIKNIQKSDTGYYGCKGVNEYGMAYNETLVYVH